jgi:hypothetical protein
MPTNNLEVFLDGIRLVLQVGSSDSPCDESGKFDLFFVRFRVQMKVLIVITDCTHEEIGYLQ